MNDKLSPLLEVSEFLEIQNNSNLVVVDARYGPHAEEEYLDSHLEDAIWVDLDKDLAGNVSAEAGGRHPLPKLSDFSQFLGQCGITESSHVVVYDRDTGALAAARFWWMMRAVGHEKIQVLNGGLKASCLAGIKMTSAEPEISPTSPYPVTKWQWPTADLNFVKELSRSGSGLIIDVRDEQRYAGKHEPIDPVAGHIPNAINVPFAGNLDEDGHFLKAEQLRDKYQAYLNQSPENKQVIHCGSGVTACHSLLALDYAGLPLPLLYVGSWSEWCRSGESIETAED